MKTLDELLQAGKEKLREIKVKEEAEANQKLLAYVAERREFWTKIYAAMKEKWPEEFVDLFLNQKTIEILPDVHWWPILHASREGLAPMSISLRVLKSDGDSITVELDGGIVVAGVTWISPNSFDNEIYEGRVEWNWGRRDRKITNDYGNAFSSEDIEIVLGVAAQRFEFYDDCLAENAVEYLRLLAEKGSDLQAKEAEYVPVDAEDTSPVDGMSQALRTLVFSFVDERLEMRG